jgi:Domain of unknown function (DUF3471)
MATLPIRRLLLPSTPRYSAASLTSRERRPIRSGPRFSAGAADACPVCADAHARQGYGDARVCGARPPDLLAFNPRFVLRITRDGDRFFAQATGQGKVENFPESETEFFAKVINAQFTFVSDGQGQVTGLVLHQSGREIPARRVDEAQAQQADAAFEERARRRAGQARPRTAIAVDAQSQDRYVGFYEADPQSIFTVTRVGDQLFAQLTGQRSLPIFPERAGEYFYRAVAAQITFVEDGQGRVNELVLHQNGGDLHAARIGDVPAGDRTAAVDSATFDAYAG